MAFLPITKQELNGTKPDFILISCDAYVDHPSFGHAIISRLIESLGFIIAIIPQPLTDNEYQRLGEPKYGFLVSGGVVDSMVNNYTVAKIRRDKDSYSEGGRVGRVPDRAVTFHCKNLKRLFPNVPIIIGGIEPSLRRFAHYDYWSDSVMPSLLVDTEADILIYGMGENPIKDIMALVKKGVPISKIRDVKGTAIMENYADFSESLLANIAKQNALFLPSFEEVSRDKKSYVKAFNVEYDNSEFYGAKTLIQKHGLNYVVINPPQAPLTTSEMDEIYSLPYERNFHPSYKDGVPAIEEVKYSITSHRGCFGACSYCAITMHQGRLISSRSIQNIVDEGKRFTHDPDFKGYIHDVSGPSANFRNPSCDKQAKYGSCKNKSCIGYDKCPNLKVDHSEFMDVLRNLRAIDGIKKVFIRSGIRYDYLMYDKECKTILKELVEHHISGQLKVAPEHMSDNVLKLMNKPSFDVYKRFADTYKAVNISLGLKQFLVPYLISSHPGCKENDAIDLAVYLKSINYMPLQVQDFYPTPSTKSTTMYYTGINPDTFEEVYVPKTPLEKKTQRALLQYRLPQNREIIREALLRNNRKYLIGNESSALIQSYEKKSKYSGKCDDEKLWSSKNIEDKNAKIRLQNCKMDGGLNFENTTKKDSVRTVINKNINNELNNKRNKKQEFNNNKCSKKNGLSTKKSSIINKQSETERRKNVAISKLNNVTQNRNNKSK